VKVFGQDGTPPYKFVVKDKNGATVASATRRTAALPLELFNLDTALSPYTVYTTDADNCTSTRPFNVVLGEPTGIPYGVILEQTYTGDDLTGRGTILLYNPATKTTDHYGYGPDGTGDGYFYDAPAGTFVDGYLLADEVTFRTWRVTDPPLIDYSDADVGGPTGSSGASTLALDNLILFNPDSSAEQNGGVLVEVNATALPVTFALPGHGSNATGSFDGLPADDYTVTCTDAVGNTLEVPFSLKLRYGRRWQLAFSDPAGVACRLELWLRDYTGAVEAIKGSGSNPVVLKSDGLSSSLGGQGDIPAVVGTACELSLLVLPGTLESVVVNDDRACRCDVYYDNVLQFRGYVQPDIYHEPLLGGLLPVTLTATDGLAGLKDTSFLGHIGQRLQGRRPLLNTLLCALSRCGVSLPLAFFVNRRSTEMSDADAPELAATTERAGYWDAEKKAPTDDRTVVDALAQALGGTLCQRAGQWQVRSPLEMLAEAPGRAYLPAGTRQSAVKASAPAGTLMPRALERGWGWVTAAQQQQLRPGWKSLAGTTDAGWLKNAFPAGEVFSDFYSWLANGGALRPIAGWVAGPAGFPLVLEQGGEKGTDYLTRWPASNGAADARYLQSPPLPLVPSPESCPAFLTVVARVTPTHYQEDGTAAADSPASLTLEVEVVVDGLRPAYPVVLTLPMAKSATDKASTTQVVLPLLPTGASQAVLYVRPWTGGLATKDAGGNYVTSTLYDPNTSVKKEEVVYIQLGGGTTGPRDYYQAKRDLLLSRYPQVPDPRVGPVAPTYRAYAANTNFRLDEYVTYAGQYYRAKYDLYNPVPAPPATGSDVNWLLVAAADLPKPQDENWLALDFTTTHAQLHISEIGIELRPQQATWDGADNFRADGPAGTVRPTEALAVYHPDVPIAAGLFAGNRHAFSKAVALADGSLSTAWARKIDLLPAPLFEANVYDALALREGPSRLLTGVLKHDGLSPPYLLDSIDTPSDVPGRRFGVGATAWDLRLARSEVSLVEIGPGADARDPLLDLPNGVRITHQAYAYAPGKYSHYARRVHGGGVRVRH